MQVSGTSTLALLFYSPKLCPLFTLDVASFVFVVLSFRSFCRGAHLVLTNVKFFEMSRLQAKLYLFICSRSPVHPSLLKKLTVSSARQGEREGQTKREEEERRRVSWGFNLSNSECCTDTVLHQDRLPDMLWLVATALDQALDGGGRIGDLWKRGRLGGWGSSSLRDGASRHDWWVQP